MPPVKPICKSSKSCNKLPLELKSGGKVWNAKDGVVNIGSRSCQVSAQPAPSGFESDSVVCSSTNRNNGRTAWDAKDEIIGRSNCPNIGTAA